MFKYKVSVYLKGGNVINLRKKYQEMKNIHRCIEITKQKIISIIEGLIITEEIQALIIKKWWQRWG